jgi:hypothetical protein
VRFSRNVAATVGLALERTTGPRAGRPLATWTIAATAGANVARVPLAIFGACARRATA